MASLMFDLKKYLKHPQLNSPNFKPSEVVTFNFIFKTFFCTLSSISFNGAYYVIKIFFANCRVAQSMLSNFLANLMKF